MKYCAIRLIPDITVMDKNYKTMDGIVKKYICKIQVTIESHRAKAYFIEAVQQFYSRNLEKDRIEKEDDFNTSGGIYKFRQEAVSYFPKKLTKIISIEGINYIVVPSFFLMQIYNDRATGYRNFYNFEDKAISEKINNGEIKVKDYLIEVVEERKEN